MPTSRLLFAWLLLLVPTLILGFGALRLLDNEEARLAVQARETARNRVLAIADSIDVSVAEVKDGLLTTLRALPDDRQIEDLDSWKRSNPLVRNVFVWQQGRGLTHPDPEQPASDEEAAFIRRYLMLFANQAAWQPPVLDLPAGAEEAEATAQFLNERQELRSLAQQAPMPAAVSAEPAPGRSVAASGGWLPWYADNRLHLLGWTGQSSATRRIGLELEMMALLSRLLGNLPAEPGEGETYALLDGDGAVFHQVGPLEIDSDSRPLATAGLHNLPHWRVAVYVPANPAGGGSGFVLIATLLVGTFVAAILLGGSLLLWQAHRNQREARQKTSFVSNVSHELKTPLTTIRMYAELLGEGKITAPERRHSYLQTIIRESQRLSRLVNNVLDFSRLEQGRKEFAREAIDLSALLHALLDSQMVRIEDSGLQPVRNIAEALTVSGDRDAIEQIVLNLLDNALKYAGGGELEIDLVAEGTDAVLRVRDRGPGIPADQRQKIFDKFHRVDSSLTARQQGTGLGLSIARQLAEGIGGRLGYCPQDGGGSCFELRLRRL